MVSRGLSWSQKHTKGLRRFQETSGLISGFMRLQRRFKGITRGLEGIQGHSNQVLGEFRSIPGMFQRVLALSREVSRAIQKASGAPVSFRSVLKNFRSITGMFYRGLSGSFRVFERHFMEFQRISLSFQGFPQEFRRGPGSLCGFQGDSSSSCSFDLPLFNLMSGTEIQIGDS